MTTGVYAIRHIVSGKSYVGSSSKIENRWVRHRSALKHNRHHSEKLQRAWNKYGADAFEFEVLQTCALSALRSVEQEWLDRLEAHRQGYNCTAKSLEHSEEVRARLAASHRGKTASPETRAKMSKAHKGLMSHEEVVRRLHTPEARRKAGDSKRGKPLDAARKETLASPEAQAKSAAARLGVKRGPYKKTAGPDGRNRPMPPEQRAKLTGRVVSVETRQRQSVAAKNRASTPAGQDALKRAGRASANLPRVQHTEATKQVLREKATGRIISEATRAKMSQAQRNRYRRVEE